MSRRVASPSKNAKAHFLQQIHRVGIIVKNPSPQCRLPAEIRQRAAKGAEAGDNDLVRHVNDICWLLLLLAGTEAGQDQTFIVKYQDGCCRHAHCRNCHHGINPAAGENDQGVHKGEQHESKLAHVRQRNGKDAVLVKREPKQPFHRTRHEGPNRNQRRHQSEHWQRVFGYNVLAEILQSLWLIQNNGMDDDSSLRSE